MHYHLEHWVVSGIARVHYGSEVDLTVNEYTYHDKEVIRKIYHEDEFYRGSSRLIR